MEVHVRTLNAGETFCCSIKKAKEIFRETSVRLDFAYFGRSYAARTETSPAYYLKRDIQGRIISKMSMCIGEKSPLLSFFILKKEFFSSELKNEYEQKYLPEFYHFYQENLNDSSLLNIQKFILVEFLNEKLKLHKGCYR